MLNEILEMDSPPVVYGEVKNIVLEMFPEFSFEMLDTLFRDTIRLFEGKYPGYRPCDAQYHNLQHTTDTFIALARLIHGGNSNGCDFSKKGLFLGLASALFHDSGYILTLDETGPGAQYTLTHIERSIDFLKEYFAKKGFSEKDMDFCEAILRCTGLNVNISQVHFLCPENEILGKMLGSADLLGQMADRSYLEKLIFLYREFLQANIKRIGTELDFLDNTPEFYKKTLARLAGDLGGVGFHVRHHFKVRWGINENLYARAIESNIDYLTYILKHHRENVHAHLKRGGLIEKLPGSKEKSCKQALKKRFEFNFRRI